LSWHLAVSAPGAERAVAVRLERQQLPYVIFRHLEASVRRGIASERLVPTFPRYVFCWADGGTAYADVKATYGIVAMIPGCVHQPVMDGLLKRADRDSVITLPKPTQRERFLTGERVRVSGGPYQGFDAIWSARTGRARCRVLLGMMGRQVPIDIDDVWLEPAAPPKVWKVKPRRPYWNSRADQAERISAS
jgi:transcriptional antiterminator RfaH